MTAVKYLSSYSDTEDIEDVLFKVAQSYNICFEPNELAHVRTFGELCDHIITKIKQKDADDCTTQQAFYKLRDLIAVSKQLDRSIIQTNTTLASIFPRHRRRKQIEEIENVLGFNLNVLRPKYFVTWTLVVLCLGSFVGLYFNWMLGLAGIIFSIFLFQLAALTAKEFDENTVGQLADKMTHENYFKSRRNPATANRKEIVKKIKQQFSNELGLSTDEEIVPETIVVKPK